MTTIGTAQFDIKGTNTQALRAVQQVADLAKKQLADLKFPVSFPGAQAALKATIKQATENVQAQIAVTLKPITQAQIDAALGKVKDEKTVKIGVSVDVQGDAVAKVAELKAKLAELKSSTQEFLTVDVSAVERVIVLLKAQIAQLQQVATQVPKQTNPNLPGQGGGGGGPPNSLVALRNELKAGQTDIAGFDAGLKRLQTTLQGDLSNMQALGVLTQDDARKLSQLTAALAGVNAEINKNDITKLRGDLAGARTAFEQAIGAAGRFNFVGQRQATTAYEQELARLQTRIREVGQQAGVTQAEMRGLNGLSQQIASQKNAINGVFSQVGLAGNVTNALKSLPQFAAQMGGSLGAAFSGAQQLTGGLERLAGAAGPVGIAIGVVVAAVAGLVTGIKAAVDSAAQFQQSLTDIKALTQPTAEQMAQLKQATYDIGKPLGVGANEAAKAVLELNKAGLSAQEVIGGGLKGALDLAGAAGVSAAESSQMVVGAMTAFGLASKDLPHIADIYANFANQTTLGASDLQQALAAVGPVARSSGIGMEQFAGIMATLAQGGFKNMSDAGTSLKTMLLSLEAPTDTAKDAMKAIGLHAFDASGKMKPFNTIIKDLQGKLGELTPEAQKQVLKMIFGTDAIRAAEILGRVGPEAVEKNTAAMKKQGEAARVARERLDSLQGAGKKFGAAMEEAKNKIGEPFLKPLQNIVEWATRLVEAFTKGGQGVSSSSVAFQQWAQTVQTALAPVIGFVKDVFNGISAAWDSVLKPVLTAAWQIFLTFQTVVMTALGVVLNVVRSVFNGVAGYVGGMVGNFTQGKQGVQVNLNSMAQSITAWAETARAYIIGVGKVAGLLPQAFAEAGRGLAQIVFSAKKFDFNGMKDGYKAVQGAVNQFGAQSGKIWAGVSADLAKTRADAAKTRDELAKPVQTQLTKPAEGKSGTKTLGDIGLVTAPKHKTTVDDINALDAYKRKLDTLDLAQLQHEKALQTSLKDTQRLRLVITEIHQREVELARAAKKAADEHTAAVKKAGDLLQRLTNTNMTFKLNVSEGKTTPESLLNYQKAIAGIQEEIAKLPKDQQSRFGALLGQSAELDKSGQSLLKLKDTIHEVAGRVRDMTVAELEAARARWAGVPAAQALVKAIDSELPRQRATEYKASVTSLTGALSEMSDAELASRLASEKASDTQGKRVTAIEKEIAARAKLRAATLLQGRLELQKNDAQAVIDDYEARKTAAQGNAQELLRIEQQSGAEVLAARQKVAQVDAEQAIIQAKDKFGQLINDARAHGQSTADLERQQSVAIQQIRDHRDLVQRQNKAASDKALIDQTKETTALLVQLENERAEATAAVDNQRDSQTVSNYEFDRAKTNTYGTEDLAAALAVEKEYENQVIAARQSMAQRSRDADVRAQTEKYRDLIAKAAGNITEQQRLQTELHDWTLDRDRALGVERDRIAWETAQGRIKAEKALADAILQINRDLTDSLNQRTQSEGDRQKAQADSDLQQELRAVGDNEEAKLAILRRTAPERERLARQSIENRMTSEREAENRRWNDLQKSSQWTAADQQRREQLDRDHQSRLTEIARQGAFDQGQAILQIQNQTDDQLGKVQEKRAQDIIKPLTKNLNDMTVAQRQTAEATLRGWLTTFQGMGAAGASAAKAIQDALDGVATANADAQQRATTTINELFTDENNRPLNLEAVKSTLAARTNKIGKADTRQDAVDKGAGAYTEEINRLKKDLKDAEKSVEDLAGAPGKALDGAGQRALERGRALVATLTAQLSATSQVAADAGTKAGDAFDKSLSDELLKAQDAAAEAALQLAEAEAKLSGEGLGSLAYGRALQAYRDYWQGRIGIAQKGVADAQAAENAARANLTSVQGNPAATEEQRTNAQTALTQAITNTATAQSALNTATTNYSNGQEKVIAVNTNYVEGLRAAHSARDQLDALMGISLISYQSEIDSLDELIKKYPEQAALLQGVRAEYERIQKIRQAGIVTKDSLKLDVQTGFNSGAGNLQKSITGVAQGLGQVMNPLNLFAEILNKINPAGAILEGVFSVLEEPIKALQEPFKLIGTLLGSVLAPVLEAVAPILTAIAEGFIAFYDALASIIKSITFGFVDITRRKPADDDKKDSGPKPADTAKSKNENDLGQTEADYKAGLIAHRKYQEEKLRLTLEGLGQQRAAEIEGAEGNAAAIREINRKYDRQEAQAKIDSANAVAEYEKTLADARAENDQKDLDRRHRQGLVSDKEYARQSYQITVDNLNRQRDAEIRAANGDQQTILEINRKYDGQILDAKLDMLDKLSEAYKQIGETLMSSITGSIKDGLLNALKTGNFGAFRSQFRKNMREAMFEAVLSAAIETAALKGILQPAIDALTAALQTDGTADDNAAIQGLLTAGSKVESKMRDVYKALKPLRDAWGIKGETSDNSSMTVTGKIDTPEVKISLDALAMLADVINNRIPAFTDALNLEIPALNQHSATLNLQTPVFSTAIDQFGIHEAAFQQSQLAFDGSVTQFGGHVTEFGQHVQTLGGAAALLAGAANTSNSKGLPAGNRTEAPAFYSKR